MERACGGGPDPKPATVSTGSDLPVTPAAATVDTGWLVGPTPPGERVCEFNPVLPHGVGWLGGSQSGRRDASLFMSFGVLPAARNGGFFISDCFTEKPYKVLHRAISSQRRQTNPSLIMFSEARNRLYYRPTTRHSNSTTGSTS